MRRTQAIWVIGLLLATVGCAGTNRRLSLGTPARSRISAAGGGTASPWPGDPFSPSGGPSTSGPGALAKVGAASDPATDRSGTSDRRTVGLRQPGSSAAIDPHTKICSTCGRRATQAPAATNPACEPVLPLALNVQVHPADPGEAGAVVASAPSTGADEDRPAPARSASKPRRFASPYPLPSPIARRPEPSDADARRVRAEPPTDARERPVPVPASEEEEELPGALPATEEEELPGALPAVEEAERPIPVPAVEEAELPTPVPATEEVDRSALVPDVEPDRPTEDPPVAEPDSEAPFGLNPWPMPASDLGPEVEATRPASIEARPRMVEVRDEPASRPRLVPADSPRRSEVSGRPLDLEGPGSGASESIAVREPVRTEAEPKPSPRLAVESLPSLLPGPPDLGPWPVESPASGLRPPTPVARETPIEAEGPAIPDPDARQMTLTSKTVAAPPADAPAEPASPPAPISDGRPKLRPVAPAAAPIPIPAGRPRLSRLPIPTPALPPHPMALPARLPEVRFPDTYGAPAASSEAKAAKVDPEARPTGLPASVKAETHVKPVFRLRLFRRLFDGDDAKAEGSR